MLNWANRFNIFCLLDNNGYHFEEPSFECLLGAGCQQAVTLDLSTAFEALRRFHLDQGGWLFGHFNYPSPGEDPVGFPAGYFFVPEVLVRLEGEEITIESAKAEPGSIFDELVNMPTGKIVESNNPVNIHHRFSKEEYIDHITQLLTHIKRGDCYEINFCQDFFAPMSDVEPIQLYRQLTRSSPNPFAAFYKLNDKYCLCASPERFLKKTGQQLISQPIKGTSKRYPANEEMDKASRDYLSASQKEKSENVMVVDLVRNDLSRVCNEGSVMVKELFGIYPFPQVYQMISTIQGELPIDLHWTKAIEACFPMGSMTGAPKRKVMELINKFEGYPRGLFSGSIGYVTPSGDFDFNVVIRSLFYNSTTKYLSFKAGSGITFYSDPELEYEECLLKAQAIAGILKA